MNLIQCFLTFLQQGPHYQRFTVSYFCNDKAVCFQTLAFTDISGVIYLLEASITELITNLNDFSCS